MIHISREHFVRVGVLGQVGRFTSVDAVSYPRQARVVCRTVRGLEIGQVLGPSESSPNRDTHSGDGSILRGVTVEDDLLLARLEKNRHSAFAACTKRLGEFACPAILVDVEHLFDGQSLFFYFLGDVPVEVERFTRELAECYEAEVQFRAFTDAVEQGCGPDCGTDKAGGCGDSCASCAVAAACKK